MWGASVSFELIILLMPYGCQRKSMGLTAMGETISISAHKPVEGELDEEWAGEIDRAEKESLNGSLSSLIGKIAPWKAIVISLCLFLLSFYCLIPDGRYVVLLAFVIALHELGHWLTARLLGYKALGVLFLPFLGGIAFIQWPPRKEPEREALVFLMGPLPGIILGAALILILPSNEWAIWLGILMLVVNCFNLLPIFPLDGYQIWSRLVFSRSGITSVIVRVISAVVLTAWWMRECITAFLKEGLIFLGIYHGVLALGALFYLKHVLQNFGRRRAIAEATCQFSKGEISSKGELPLEMTVSELQTINNLLERKLDRQRDGKSRKEAIEEVWEGRFYPARLRSVLLYVSLYVAMIGGGLFFFHQLTKPKAALPETLPTRNELRGDQPSNGKITPIYAQKNGSKK